MNQNLFTLVAFSATDLIGTHRFNKIMSHFENIYDFLECDTNYQMEFLELKSPHAAKTLNNMVRHAHHIVDMCEKTHTKLISIFDPEYPSQLKSLIDPPYILYVQGNFQQHIPLVGVIGTRKSTQDAEEVNRWFCESFVNYSIGIVSGLAQGHDSIAAESVLQSNGYTVGVLGTAIDIVYPARSRYLYDKVREQGAIISEYPHGMATTKWRFPRRNRIVSGLAQAILVVQAPEKSGTMITVNMATDQGKDVYVIPGNPLNQANSGTNKLIQRGAKVALNPNDIITELLQSNDNIQVAQFIKKNIPTPEPKKFEIDPALPLEERQILEITNSPTHIDEIVRMLGINTSQVTALLTMMEIKGLIIQKPGQLYIREEQ